MATSSPWSRTISATFSAKSRLSSTMRYPRMGSSGGQDDREPRAATLAIRVGHAAAVPLGDPLHQREHEPDDALLRRDERLEEAAARAGVDPGPRVLDVALHDPVAQAPAHRDRPRRRGGLDG